MDLVDSLKNILKSYRHKNRAEREEGGMEQIIFLPYFYL